MHTLLASVRTLCINEACPHWTTCTATPAPRSGGIPPFEPALVANVTSGGVVSVVCLSFPERRQEDYHNAS